MDLEFSHNGGNDLDFEFAFNSSNFSDRVLTIEIVDGVANGPEEDNVGDGGPSEWAARRRKRRREEIKVIKREQGVELETSLTEVTLSCKQLGASDDIIIKQENLEGDAVATIEEPLSGDSHSQGCSSWNMKVAPVREKSIYVSSAILAAKSRFFFKIFSNGMRESNQQHVSLTINATEEVAFMELLSFMYNGKLTTTSPPQLLDILMAADKYEVPSCMKFCSQLLRSLPMCKESALLYLELPSSVSMASAVQPLTDAARQFLAYNFKDLTKPQEGLMELPLVGIEAILSSDDLQVASEDAVYEFVLKWARQHYPNAEERKLILGSSLVPLIRFPFMTCKKLKKVLSNNDIDKEMASKFVLEALFLKADAPNRQRSLPSCSTPNRRFIERAYKYRPVKVVQFDLPHQKCIVYLDLKRQECASLFPSGRIYSQAFFLSGQGFFLSAHCNMDQQSAFHCFGLFLGMQDRGFVSFPVEYEFSVTTRTPGGCDFVSKHKGNYTFIGGKAVGYRNLFGLPWTSFMADDSPYFIGDFLHLRAELIVKLPPPLQQLQQQ